MHAETSGQEASTSGREYLAYFLHRHLDFRLPELESLIDFEDRGLTYSWRKPFGGLIYSPFWYLRLPSDETARKLCKRVLLLKVTFSSYDLRPCAYSPLSSGAYKRRTCYACKGVVDEHCTASAPLSPESDSSHSLASSGNSACQICTFMSNLNKRTCISVPNHAGFPKDVTVNERTCNTQSCRVSLRSGAREQHGRSWCSLSRPFQRHASCPGSAPTQA